jgi:virginiamycin B lyase
MSFSFWLRYWKRSLERRSALHQNRRAKPAASRRTRRLRLETLEDRTLLSSFTEFSVPTLNSHPGGIFKGPDGNLWFTEDNADKIGRITPAGAFKEFAVNVPNNRTWAIPAGPDPNSPDGNIWFATEGDGVTGQVGRINPSTGEMTLFPILPAYSYPSITIGSDGN